MPTIRIDYYETNRLPLIVGPVQESVSQLRALCPDALIVVRTGWLYGPHVEICVTGAQIDVAPQIDSIRQWVAEHPSTRQLGADEYEMLCRKVGVLEGIKGPYLPLRPDNTVELVQDHQPRLVDGHEVLQPSYMRFFDRSAPVLFMLAALRSTDLSLATIVQIALLAQAAGRYKPEGLARGYLSLQAHADFFFANFDRGGNYHRHYDRLSEQWREKIEQAVQGHPQAAAGDRQTREQIVAIMRLWDAVLEDTEAEIRGVISLDNSWFDYNPAAFPEEMEDKYKEGFDSAGMETRAIEKGETLDTMLGGVDPAFFRSENFQTFRVILNMYYSFLRTLNVSPAERFGLCYLAATTFCRMRDAGLLAAVG